jgi:hypothetical protein
MNNAEYAYPLVVKAIVKDLPGNSSIKGDYFTSSGRKIIYEARSTEPQHVILWILSDMNNN